MLNLENDILLFATHGIELVEASDEERLDLYRIVSSANSLTRINCTVDYTKFSLQQFGIITRLIAAFGGSQKESWSKD